MGRIFKTKKLEKEGKFMNIVVRREEERDYRRVEEIAREAFWNLYFQEQIYLL